MVNYRQMNFDDIPAGLALCRSAGWNQLTTDWELFLNKNEEGCIVAINEKEVVIGTVTTIRYDNHFCWIGMVLVDPSMKRQGIGTQLLIRSIKLLEAEKTIKLDATPAGREVYLKLEFVDEYSLSRMYNNKTEYQSLQFHGATLIHEKDFGDLLNVDAEVFGAERKDVLKWIWKNAPELAYIKRDQKDVAAYCFGRKGFNFIHIGPVVAHQIDDAIQVVSAALQHAKGRPVIMDANHDPSWMRWLTSVGFQEQRPFTRMYKGENAFPGLPEKQFAILGPEFG